MPDQTRFNIAFEIGGRNGSMPENSLITKSLVLGSDSKTEPRQTRSVFEETEVKK